MDAKTTTTNNHDGKDDEDFNKICTKWLQEPEPTATSQPTPMTIDNDEDQDKTEEEQDLKRQLQSPWTPAVAKQAIQERLDAIKKQRSNPSETSNVQNNLNNAMDVKILAEKMVQLKQNKAKLLELHQKKVDNAQKQKEEADKQLVALRLSQKQIVETQDAEINRVEKAMNLAQKAAQGDSNTMPEKMEETLLATVVAPTQAMIQEAGPLNTLLGKLALPTAAQAELLTTITNMMAQATEANKEQLRTALKHDPTPPPQKPNIKELEGKEASKRDAGQIADSAAMEV